VVEQPIRNRQVVGSTPTLGSNIPFISNTFCILGSDPLDETDLAGNTNNASFNEYIFFGGKRIARRDSTNNFNYYFADHLGTARIVANSAGTILDDSDFYPFGGERVISSSSGNNYKFTSKEHDSESGLDNFGARFDSSSFGRFMSPDPGNIGVDRRYPQSWNAYSYSVNNPLVLTDPTGLYVCEDSEKCDSANDKAFAKSLADAQTAANKLTGDDQAAAQRAIDAYGAQGVDNGVNVRFDANITENGAVTEVSGVANGNKSADNPTGQNINVTFKPDAVGGDSGGGLVAHEGSHVADASAWVASGFSAQMNPTNRDTEFRAYHVQFNVLNAIGNMKFSEGYAGGFFGFKSGRLSWANGDTFKKITPDLQQKLNENYKNLDLPAFKKGGVLQP
jgi:RHS repeat-associated protein